MIYLWLNVAASISFRLHARRLHIDKYGTRRGLWLRDGVIHRLPYSADRRPLMTPSPGLDSSIHILPG